MVAATGRKSAKPKRIGYLKNIAQNPMLYLMAVPVIAYILSFVICPMYGVVIAFQDYVPARGILNSNWVGLKHFASFFTSTYFPRLVRNTLEINIKELVFSFPVPILFALLLNEVRSTRFRRIHNPSPICRILSLQSLSVVCWWTLPKAPAYLPTCLSLLVWIV